MSAQVPALVWGLTFWMKQPIHAISAKHALKVASMVDSEKEVELERVGRGGRLGD
jgi:hypothetical protein